MKSWRLNRQPSWPISPPGRTWSRPRWRSAHRWRPAARPLGKQLAARRSSGTRPGGLSGAGGFQPDCSQSSSLFIPALAFLDVKEQVHWAIQQKTEVLPGVRPDCFDLAAFIADQDRLVARAANVDRQADPNGAVLAFLKGFRLDGRAVGHFFMRLHED